MIRDTHRGNADADGMQQFQAVTAAHASEAIAAHLEEARSLLAGFDAADIASVVARLADATVSGQQIFIAGNGGSAALASHLATDLGKNARSARLRPRVTALVDNTALMTALANDVGYEHVFAEQLRTHASPDDVLIVISGSGNSPNILEAVRVAREMGVFCVALCGFNGGRLADMADMALVAEASSIELAEDLHCAISHSFTVGLRLALAKLSDNIVKLAPAKPAIFLDRDGVVNQRRGDHVKQWDEFVFADGALEAILRLTELGHEIVVVTNQAAIGRGLVRADVVDEIHSKMCAQVGASGGRIEAVYLCPHAPWESCGCRKPRPGLLHRASGELGIDLPRSTVIGDTLSDMAAARAAGCRGILVSTDPQDARSLRRDFERRRFASAASLPEAAFLLTKESFAADRPMLRLATAISM